MVENKEDDRKKQITLVNDKIREAQNKFVPLRQKPK